mgnify:CR=1 FL=1
MYVRGTAVSQDLQFSEDKAVNAAVFALAKKMGNKLSAKNKIMIKGWEKESGQTPNQVFKNYNDTNIKGYVLTDIENDGMLTGLNTKMILENLEKTKIS